MNVSTRLLVAIFCCAVLSISPNSVLGSDAGISEIKYFELVVNDKFDPSIQEDFKRNPRFLVKGRIYNHTETEIPRFAVEVIFHDCNKLGNNCTIIGRERIVFDEDFHYGEGVPIPPGEARDFVRGVQNIPVAKETLYVSHVVEFDIQPFRDVLSETFRKRFERRYE